MNYHKSLCRIILQNLQYYIQKVIWSDPEQVAETYSLLQSLKEPLPLAVYE